jgi:ABC-2 type transport system permease protein
MMFLSVARTHWIKFGRDRAGMIMSFVVPIVFFSLFAIMLGGAGRGGSSRLRVALVDQTGGKASAFLGVLRAEKSLDLLDHALDERGDRKLPMTPETAEKEIRSGAVGLAMIIPPQFSDARLAAVDNGARPGIEILADTSDPFSSRVLSGLLQNVAVRTVRGVHAANAAGTPGAVPPAVGAIVDVSTRDLLGASKANPRIAFSAAGLGVMFLLFIAAAAGGAIIDEAENGTLDRILASRVSMTQLLLGKLLYLVGLSTLQLTVTFTWGALVFGVELRKHLVGFLIMTVATSLATSAFGLLLAAICRTRAQLAALSNLTVLVMSALGGSMFPRFLMPEKLQKLGLITINGWALDGFLKIFWREEPLIRIWPQVTVLVLGAAMIFTAARIVARKWETA